MSILADMNMIRVRNCLSSPRLMQLEITKSCPLNCPQCYKDPNKIQVEMSFNDFKKYVDDASSCGVKQISLLGGEPLIHKDIISMVNYCSEKNILATIYTSGIGLNEKLIDEFNKVSNHLLLMLSMNGSKNEIHQKSRDGFKYSYKAAQLMNKNRFKYGINWVARHDNYYDFPNLVNLAINMGASFVNVVLNKINGNLVVDSPLTYSDFLWLCNYINKFQDRPYITIQKCFDQMVQKTYKIPRTILSGCQAGISVCAISADGLFQPCLHLNSKESFSTIKEYWTQSKVLEQLRNNQISCNGCINKCRFCKAMDKSCYLDYNSVPKHCFAKEENKNVEGIAI